MKKIICILLIASILLSFASCGNMSMGFGNFEYSKVHIDTYHFSRCLTVIEWYEATTGVEVTTEECGSLFLSEGTYTLIADECPYCSHPTKKGGEAE